MSNQTITVEVQYREVIGKGLGKLKAQGIIPAVVHDHGKQSLHVQGDLLTLSKIYSQAGKHHPVHLKLNGKDRLALIKDVDFEPTKNRIRHIVFQAIKQNEKVTAEIPVVLTGEDIPAERKSLLVLTQLDYVEVEALPSKLPSQLEVDATVLDDVGDKLHVSDIKAPEGVTILTEPELQLAVVEMPRDQVAEADAAAADLAADAAEATEVPTTDQKEDVDTTESPDSEELKDEE